MTRLSILVTYHNERLFLAECLSSLISSGRRPDEVLVYDDASAFPAEDYIPVGVDAKVLRGEAQLGPAKARNILLRAARGKYVHFHDADDLFSREWLTTIEEEVEAGGVDAIFTNVVSIKDGKVVSARLYEFPSADMQEDLVTYSIRGPILPCSCTFLRELALSIGGFREHLWQSEDYDFYIRLAATGMRWRAVDMPLVSLRLRPDSRSTNRKEVYVSALEAIGYLAQELPHRYRNELAESAARVAGILFRLGARDEAMSGFSLARSIGMPKYPHQNTIYRVVAATCGPLAAERLGALYRALPVGLRERARALTPTRPVR